MDSTSPTRDINKRLLLTLHQDGLLDVLASFVVFEHLFLKGLLLHHGIPLAGFVSGGIIMLSGWVQLYRFIKRYTVD